MTDDAGPDQALAAHNLLWTTLLKVLLFATCFASQR